MVRCFWLALTLLVSVGATGQAPALRALIGTTFAATVVRIVDGDTLEVVRDADRASGAKLRIRLDGIDAPERGEPFNQVAERRLRVLTFDQRVRIDGRDVDRYGRLVARVVVGTVDVSAELVGEGLACFFRKYSSDRVLARAEDDAVTRGLGFWSATSAKPACTAARASTSGVAAGLLGRAAASTPTGFVGNASSHLFHAASCRNADCKNCTRTFASRAEAEAAGFKAAKDCLR